MCAAKSGCTVPDLRRKDLSPFGLPPPGMNAVCVDCTLKLCETISLVCNSPNFHNWLKKTPIQAQGGAGAGIPADLLAAGAPTPSPPTHQHSQEAAHPRAKEVTTASLQVSTGALPAGLALAMAEAGRPAGHRTGDSADHTEVLSVGAQSHLGTPMFISEVTSTERLATKLFSVRQLCLLGQKTKYRPKGQRQPSKILEGK